MNSKIAGLMGGAAAIVLMLTACGGSHHGGTSPVTMTNPPPPPPPMTKNLDTAALVSLIQTQTSETADPFEVDNAAVAVTPVGDETGAPMPVDAI